MTSSSQTGSLEKAVQLESAAADALQDRAVKPVRVQLSRAKGFRLQEASLALNGLPAVKVDRSTTWGNHDFVVGEDYDDAETCVEMFHHDLDKFAVFHPEKFDAWIAPLRGKNLACWCKISPCHADVLLELANAPPVQQALSRRNGGDSRLCSTPIDPPLNGAKGG